MLANRPFRKLVKTGNLVVQTGTFSKSATVEVVLCSDIIAVLHKDKQNGGKVLKAYSLDNLRTVNRDEPEYSFEIYKRKKKKPMLFTSLSNTECNTWVSSIQEAVVNYEDQVQNGNNVFCEEPDEISQDTSEIPTIDELR